MVLKLKYLLVFSCFSMFCIQTQAQTQKLFFSDKYDVNYFYNNEIDITNLYIASDLFSLLSEKEIDLCKEYIDSFLIAENMNYELSFELENKNKFNIKLKEADFKKTQAISINWVENYKLNFQKLILSNTNHLEKNIVNPSSITNIIKKIAKLEQGHFFSYNSNVTNVTMAFVLPMQQEYTTLEPYVADYSTKRYNEKEIQLLATEILYNKNLALNEIKYYFPASNKQSFLKNCISADILEQLHSQDFKFRHQYNIKQCTGSFSIFTTDSTIKQINVNIPKGSLSNYEFELIKNKAFENIVKKASNHFFYFSYLDLVKLEQIKSEYNIENYWQYVNLINTREHFILEIHPNSSFIYKEMKLIKFQLETFTKAIAIKSNSVVFLNKEDSILLKQLSLFLKLNTQYKLSIIGKAKESEFLFVGNEKIETIISKYEKNGYVMSRKRKLALYRALVIFNELNSSGIVHQRLKCIGIKSKTPAIELNLFLES